MRQNQKGDRSIFPVRKIDLSPFCPFCPLLVAALALTVAGCGSPPADYFPLGTRQQWEYGVSRTIKGQEQRQKLLLANLPPVTLEGRQYFPQRRLDGTVDLFERVADGIFHVNPANEARVRILPMPMEVGASWSEKTTIRFLEITGAFAPTFLERISNSIALDFVIESVDETVDTPAGRFANCLRVRGSGSMFAGQTLRTYLGIRFINVDQTEWYAPGIGLVKSVRNEYTTPAEHNNTYVRELHALR
jgi:hypothetical protein